MGPYSLGLVAIFFYYYFLLFNLIFFYVFSSLLSLVLIWSILFKIFQFGLYVIAYTSQIIFKSFFFYLLETSFVTQSIKNINSLSSNDKYDFHGLNDDNECLTPHVD